MRIEQKLPIPLIIIAFGNMVTGIILSETLIYFISYVAIFVLIAIILPFIKIEKSFIHMSYLLLFLSLMALWFDDIRSLFGIMLFTYSIYLSTKNKRTYLIYGILAGLTILLRFAIYSLNAMDLAVYLAGTSFVLIIYQHYIHPKTEKVNTQSITLKNYKSNKVKDDVVDIVHLRTLGFNWDEINVKLSLCVTDDRVRRIVADERKHLGFKNQDQMVLWMLESGILKPISDNLIREA